MSLKGWYSTRCIICVHFPRNILSSRSRSLVGWQQTYRKQRQPFQNFTGDSSARCNHSLARFHRSFSKSSLDASDSSEHQQTAATTVRKVLVSSKHHRESRSSNVSTQRLTFDNQNHEFSPIWLRDICECDQCVDHSTRQKRFSTPEIPSSINPLSLAVENDNLLVTWENDIPGYGDDHRSIIPLRKLRTLKTFGKAEPPPPWPPRVLWNAAELKQQLRDIDYHSYMTDDRILYDVLKRLHSHGLVFVCDVPESEESVSAIAERIGPLKTTFYGRTWDVRSVPDAINAAYTSQDLGFHMDLLYMKQPPHLQMLHCLRTSAIGGISRFVDSFKAAVDLAAVDRFSFNQLQTSKVSFHYDHPGSQYYWQSRYAIETRNVSIGPIQTNGITRAQKLRAKYPMNHELAKLETIDFIRAVSWSPPFQAPFALPGPLVKRRASDSDTIPLKALGESVDKWHMAAKAFDKLLHRPGEVYERLLEPGVCVIFDNRRILHARTAFEVEDAGKERWLKGCYVDEDPYYSRLKTLADQMKSHLDERSQGEL